MEDSGDSPAPDSETGSPRGDPEEAAEISRAKVLIKLPRHHYHRRGFLNLSHTVFADISPVSRSYP